MESMEEGTEITRQQRRRSKSSLETKNGDGNGSLEGFLNRQNIPMGMLES